MNELLEISERLEQLWNEVKEDTDVSKTVVPVYDATLSISQLFCNLKRELKEIGENKNQQFLGIPLIEKFIEMVLPYYKVSINDVISGKAERKVEHLKEFQSLLEQSEVYKRWDVVNDSIQKTIQTMSLPNNIYETGHLQYICDAIKNALTFLEKKQALLICSGDYADTLCKVVPYISLHRSVYEFTKQLEDSPNPSFITFGAVFPTFGDNEDRMYAYLHDMPCDVRVSNFSRNNRKSIEEIRSTEDSYHYQIIIGIKNGENIWEIPTYVAQNCVFHKGYEDFFDYGERRTYLPLQVFFVDRPIPSKETKELAVVRSGYWLKDLIDSHQSVWLVSLLSELQKKFFKEVKRENKEKTYDVIFKEELRINLLKKEENATISQSQETLPVVYNYQIEIDIENLCTTEKERELIDFLQIKPEDFIGLPVWNDDQYLNQKAAEDTLKWNASQILGKLAAERLMEKMDFYLGENETEIHKRIKDRESQILSMLVERNPQIARCTTIYEHKKPIRSLCESAEVGKIANITKYDSLTMKEYRKRKTYFFYPKELENKKPPIIVNIFPQTTEELLCLLGYTEETAPEVLKYYGFLEFNEKHRKKVFGNMVFSNQINSKNNSEREKFMDILKVQLWFGKREYKKIMERPK